jgi:poly-D-alanine transfer protein DltD
MAASTREARITLSPRPPRLGKHYSRLVVDQKVKEAGISMVTSAIRGILVRSHATRTEVLNLIYGSAEL